ncbi:MAG: hypothetical protein JL50_21105 [Peptococcaceae bacterium BICA1-7]|nr:MAG: hypothetical protein JL50_21105 [Peptococcaceae bacterium BICA1-7]HBV97175.1 hypothetical protein [Desulfotomaculum sp.]
MGVQYIELLYRKGEGINRAIYRSQLLPFNEGAVKDDDLAAGRRQKPERSRTRLSRAVVSLGEEFKGSTDAGLNRECDVFSDTPQSFYGICSQQIIYSSALKRHMVS